MVDNWMKMAVALNLLLLIEVLICCWMQCAKASHLINGRKKDTMPFSLTSLKGNLTLLDLLETSTSDPRSFILEKYGRHYRLNGDTKMNPSLTFDLTTGKKKNDIPSSGMFYSEEDQKSPDNLEYGLSDVKSIIMEKYGRHYRLTGGSTLAATKRHKGEAAVILDAVNETKADNDTVQVSNSSQTLTTRDETVNTTNGVSVTANNESLPLKAAGNESLANLTNVDANNNTLTRSVINSSNKTETGSKPANVSSFMFPDDTAMALPITKNATDNKGTQEIVFGHPPPPPQTGDSENNITEEGNLTTITIDLTKGNTSAVIPGLDVLKSPVQSVDVIVENGKNSNNAPKRSGTSATKHNKKHIVFQMTKPRMAIQDFANKRKHVPHRHKKCKHSSKRKHIHRKHHKCRNKKTLSENRGKFVE